jgi:ABC-type transport system involved in cytochrome bd biosynthesis fused ATPase/permease subunit
VCSSSSRAREREAQRTRWSARAQARLIVVELSDGLPELRSFGAERLAADEVLRNVARAVAAKQRLARLSAQGHAVIGLLADSTLLMAVLDAAGLLLGPRLSAPIFVLVCLAFIALVEPLAAVPAAVIGLAQARSAAARLVDMFSANHFRIVRDNLLHSQFQASAPSCIRSGPGGVLAEWQARCIGGSAFASVVGYGCPDQLL